MAEWRVVRSWLGNMPSFVVSDDPCAVLQSWADAKQPRRGRDDKPIGPLEFKEENATVTAFFRREKKRHTFAKLERTGRDGGDK